MGSSQISFGGYVIEWRTIPGWEGFYEASSDGKIRSVDREIPFGRWGHVKRKGHLIVPRLTPFGYWRVALRDGKTRKYIHVHRLVCMAFHGMPKDGQIAAHYPSSDRNNNNAENVIWATHKTNSSHMREHGTAPIGEKNPSSKITQEQANEIRSSYVRGRPCHPGNIKELMDKFDLSRGGIQAIIYGKTWRSP